VKQVTNGKGAMPAFKGKLTDEDIQDVASFVLSKSEAGW
jgi:cytochrome c6